MVAVRSAHLNKAGEFDPKKWIASLGISSQQSCERLAETWDYCREKTQGHPQADLLLWRGVEMVEILSTLSMDIDTLRAALLFPLRRLIGDLCTYLSIRDGGVQRFLLRLEHEEGATDVDVGLLTPERAPALLFELARNRLERVEIPRPVVAMRLPER